MWCTGEARPVSDSGGVLGNFLGFITRNFGNFLVFISRDFLDIKRIRVRVWVGENERVEYRSRRVRGGGGRSRATF